MKKDILKLKEIDSKYFLNPKEYIPVGAYCGGCIFWDMDKTKPFQMNGYCHYLKKGDWELNKEFEIYDTKTGKKVNFKDREGIPMSLLWDGCKECGVNDYEIGCLDCKHSKDFSGYSCMCTLKNEMIDDIEFECDSFESRT